MKNSTWGAYKEEVNGRRGSSSMGGGFQTIKKTFPVKCSIILFIKYKKEEIKK
ncbi:unnamed protein product [Spirodela intermedia]|uniref:Uncharacterized protein n=1 Tax=Spirodela intermedia TaxID=51605 RepID=A0A7I8KEC9_SPIIN|nr:unnamed protein product [Spirodela intermedia]